MSTAYVKINVKPQRWAKDVRDALRREPGVTSADAVTGIYDVIAMVEFTDVDALASWLNDTVMNFPGVDRAVTSIALE